jgi:hypothetical protein
MSGRRAAGKPAAIGGLAAVIALLAGLPVVKADELSDLRTDRQELQQRLDQLSQPPPTLGAPLLPGAAPGATLPEQPPTIGSFPRSFVIPGTETSVTIGGSVQTNFLYGISR